MPLASPFRSAIPASRAISFQCVSLAQSSADGCLLLLELSQRNSVTWPSFRSQPFNGCRGLQVEMCLSRCLNGRSEQHKHGNDEPQNQHGQKRDEKCRWKCSLGLVCFDQVKRRKRRCSIQKRNITCASASVTTSDVETI